MNSQSAATAFGQDLEITARLSRLDHTKRVLLAGHGKISSVVTSDLQKDSGIWPAFVSLPGGMQKTRAEFHAGGNMLLVPKRVAHLLQCCVVPGIHLNV